MTNYKGKGEHSVNELEKIIQEQIEIIYELKQELKFHKEQNEAMSSDMDKMQNMIP